MSPDLLLKPTLPPCPSSQLRVPAPYVSVPTNLDPLPPYPPRAPVLPDNACGQPGHCPEHPELALALPAPPPPPDTMTVMFLEISVPDGVGIVHEPFDVYVTAA